MVVGKIKFLDFQNHDSMLRKMAEVVGLLGLMDPRNGFYPIRLDNVYLKESKIHGRGLFAKCDIANQEVITYYPADIVISREAINGITGLYKSAISDRFRDKFGTTLKFDLSYHIYQDYKFEVSDKLWAIGCPEFDQDPQFMGQFINDGRSCDSSEESIRLYKENPFDGFNCLIYPAVQTAIIAVKDIKKDEEILTCYGAPYWTSYNFRKKLQNEKVNRVKK